MNLNKICRLCAITHDEDDLYNMFSKDVDINLLTNIETFASIKISENDGLPNKICIECYHTLLDMYHFRAQIIKSIEKLKKTVTKDTSNNSDCENSASDIKTDVSSDCESKKSETTSEYQPPNRTNSSNVLEQSKNRRETKTGQKKVADPASKTIICPVCGKILKRNSYSDHFSNLHQDEANIECDVCGKMFKNKRQLWHHKRKHQDQTCSCDQCGKTFKNREGFRAHFKTIHLGIRNHICKICSRKFARIMALKQHMRSHTGEKPYACSYCSRSFAGKWTLKQHIRLHTKDKPYRCQMCGDAFTQNVMLKVHIKNKHS